MGATYRPDDFPPLRDCADSRAAFAAMLAIDCAAGTGPGLCVGTGGDLVLVRAKVVSSPIVAAFLGPRVVTTVVEVYAAGLRAPREANVAEREAERLARYVAEARAEHERWREEFRARRHAEEKGLAFDRHAEDESSDDQRPPLPGEACTG